jgi:hypothetical protein
LVISVTLVECVRVPEVPVTVTVEVVESGGVRGAFPQPCIETAAANTIIMQARRTAYPFVETLRARASRNSVMLESNQTIDRRNGWILERRARFIFPSPVHAIEVEETVITEVAIAALNVSEGGVKPQV